MILWNQDKLEGPIFNSYTVLLLQCILTLLFDFSLSMEKMENNESKAKGRADTKKYENEKRKREFYSKWKEDYKRVE